MTLIYLVITLALATSYAFLITYIIKQWHSIPIYNYQSQEIVQEGGLSIIIPARNEEKNIERCIQSILTNENIDQLKIQIIVIDDHSDDSTAEIVGQISDPRVQLISLKNYLKKTDKKINAFKKIAINAGLESATYNHIVQLDADTEIPKHYLTTVQNYLSDKTPDFIAGPIIFNKSKSILETFQQLDIMGMMAVTAAGIHSGKWYMANGANMIYKKTNHRFESDNIASGDDVYTIQNLAQDNSKRIEFVKSKHAIVSANPVETLSAFYRQRLRWATKNKSMTSLAMKVMMVIPFLNAIWILLHLSGYFYFGMISLLLLLCHISIKCMADYLLLSEMSDFFGQEKVMKSFLPANLLHIIYIVIIGILSLFVKNYEWKGRKVH